MRKSREVNVVLLAAVALSVTGCRGGHGDCVDSQSRLLPDSSCRTGVPGAHYLYGGASGGHVGDSVVGGSVSRGGFGSIGGSHAGGGE